MNTQFGRLFRAEAVDHYLREEEGRGVLRVSPPWAVTLVCVAGCMVLACLGFAIFGKVEVTDRAKGILRPASGVRSLAAPGAAVVGEVLARSGDFVKQGTPILRLDSASLKASLYEADQALGLLDREFPDVATQQDRLYERRKADCLKHIESAREEVASFEHLVQVQTRHEAAQKELARLGISGQMDLDAAEEALEQARRQLRAGRITQAQVQQELASLESDRRRDLFTRKSDHTTARARKDALGFSLSQNGLSAAMDGFLDGLAVHPGDQVQAGQVLCRLIPADQPLQAVCFLPEKNRGFLGMGDRVQVELHQYPYAEFGTVRGKVVKVGQDLASTQDWREAFGDEAKDPGPVVRVEIELEPPSGPMAKARFRPGMVADVRFTLRRQSLLAFAFSPLKRWLD